MKVAVSSWLWLDSEGMCQAPPCCSRSQLRMFPVSDTKSFSLTLRPGGRLPRDGP